MIRILICEHSGFLRFLLGELISNENFAEVEDPEADCLQLEKKIKEAQPDILLVGAGFLSKHAKKLKSGLIKETNLPVLVILEEKHSNLYHQVNAEFQVLVESMLVTENLLSQNFLKFKETLLQKIRKLHYLKKNLTESGLLQYSEKPLSESVQRKRLYTKPEFLLVIGASTGGSQAIETIINSLDPNLKAAILIAVHLPANFTKSFAKRLNELTELKVEEGNNGMKLEAGKIIVAPGGANMEITHTMGSYDNLFLSVIKDDKKVLYDQPSIDKLMISAARYGNKNVLGVILSGMGTDGVQGAEAVKNAGGTVVVQDQESSVIFGMASAAIASGAVSEVLPLNQIGNYINDFKAIEKAQKNTVVQNSADEIERAGI